MIISNGQQKTDESDNNGGKFQVEGTIVKKVYNWGVLGKNVSNTGTQTQYEPFEKFNWYIYLQYVQGDIDTCKKLIKKEVERCGGYNDFILYTQVSITIKSRVPMHGRVYTSERLWFIVIIQFKLCFSTKYAFYDNHLKWQHLKIFQGSHGQK